MQTTVPDPKAIIACNALKQCYKTYLYTVEMSPKKSILQVFAWLPVLVIETNSLNRTNFIYMPNKKDTNVLVMCSWGRVQVCVKGNVQVKAANGYSGTEKSLYFINYFSFHDESY